MAGTESSPQEKFFGFSATGEGSPSGKAGPIEAFANSEAALLYLTKKASLWNSFLRKYIGIAVKRFFGTEEVIQDALLAAVKNKERLIGLREDELCLFFKKILLNTILNLSRYLERGRRGPAALNQTVYLSELDESMIGEATWCSATQVERPEDSPQLDEAIQSLVKALESLSDEEAVLFLDARLHGLSLKEAARRQESIPKVASAKLWAIKRKLRELLEGSFGLSSGELP